ASARATEDLPVAGVPVRAQNPEAVAPNRRSTSTLPARRLAFPRRPAWAGAKVFKDPPAWARRLRHAGGFPWSKAMNSPRTEKSTWSLVQPSRRLRAFHAFALAFIMSTGGFLVLGAASAHPLSTASSPTASPAVPLSGAQLQQAPYETVPGAAVAQHPGAKVVDASAPATPVTFTVGFQMRNSAQL